MIVLSYLWRIYLFITISTVVALLVLAQLQWKNIKTEADTELRYLNTVSSNATRAMLDYQKSIFRTLSAELLELDLEKNSRRVQKLIDNLINNNPNIAAFAIKDAEGVLKVINKDARGIKDIQTILKDPLAEYNFKRAYESTELVIGNSRFIPALNQQIIGIHYAVRKNNRVIAVLFSAIKHDVESSAWSNSHLTNDTILQIFRDDYHFVYSSRPQFSKNPREYLTPIPEGIVNYFIQEMQVQSGVSVEELQSKEQLVSVSALYAKDMNAMFTIQYQRQYKYYTLSSVETSSLYNKLIPTLTWQLSVLIIFNLFLYAMFRFFHQEQEKAKGQLVFQANHDQLTGLPNRYYLAKYFDQWSRSCQGKFAIFFIDLDNFKIINDHYGHLSGDQILIEVARRIEAQFKDLNIRHGGDEFIIFIPENNDAYLLQLANNFINDLMLPISVANTDFSVTSSIGIVRAPTNGSELGILLSKADIAMYEAKKHRNEAFIFSRELEGRSAYNVAIQRELRTAIERDELSMVYQPQVSASTNKTIGVEALVRWHNKELGTVPPNDFIPIAESIGLMNELGKFITLRAIREIEAVCSQVGPIRLAINVSVQQLLTDGFFEFVQEEINRNINDKLALMLEVTESIFIEDLKLAIHILQRFSDIGVEISLDDFGTGYSSLSLLASLPIDELKIDKSFVDQIEGDEKTQNLVRSIITIGRDLKLSILAEGVEEEAQLAMLSQLGCDLIQGYYYSKPLKKADLIEFLSNTSK